MDIKDKDAVNIARRNFAKTGAVAALGMASAGCATSSASVAGTQSAGKATQRPSECDGKYGFESTPDPIPSFKITETTTSDVVVVGAGISGVMAALSAQEAGAKTIVLQKGPIVMCHGTGMGAINTKLQLEKNCHVDKIGAINEFQYQSLNKPKYQLLKKWADHSGETFDWINEITTELGTPGTFTESAGSPTGDTAGGKTWYKAYSTGHSWQGGMMKAINLVARKAIQKGVEFRFYTPGIQLIRNSAGRITGVIAKSEKTGEYKQFNARKGVIICTGDYGNNSDMVAKYCPSAVGLQNYYQPRYNTGDGHLMGLWIGAAMEQGPHTKMAHVHSSLEYGKGDAPSKNAPWLSVNPNGERFCNEDLPFFLMANQTGGDNGGGNYYHIMDSDWEKNLRQFSPRILMQARPGDFEQALKAGTIVQADTLEELASRLGLPPGNLKKTVARYNQLVDKGVDEDFGKDANDLTLIRKAPFYGIPRLACVSVILGGLNINTDMQVLDTAGKVIPGLYAAGNASGGFFGGANDYPFPIIAVSVGRAATFGRLAGKHAATA